MKQAIVWAVVAVGLGACASPKFEMVAADLYGPKGDYVTCGPFEYNGGDSKTAAQQSLRECIADRQRAGYLLVTPQGEGEAPVKAVSPRDKCMNLNSSVCVQ